MKILPSVRIAALFALAAPVLAQQPGAVPDVPEIAPAPAARGDCERCRQGGMGRMAHAEMRGMQHGRDGQGCCSGMGGMQKEGMRCGGLGGGDTAMLERRIIEPEKRLDLMQPLITQTRKR